MKQLPGLMEGVKMKHYLDKKYMIVDHTLLNYMDDNVSVKIPEQKGNINIRTIGEGAFMDLQKLQYVMLPPKINTIGNSAFYNNQSLISVVMPGSIQKVGSSAFTGCNQLSDIVLYDYQIEQTSYEILKANSLRTEEGIYVARKMPEFELVQQILNADAAVSSAYSVPDGIQRLFYTSQIKEDKGFQLIYRNLNTIDFVHKHSMPMSEDDGVREYLTNAFPNPDAENADEENDRLLRINKPRNPLKTVIFTFDDSKTVDIKGKKSLSVTLRLGYFFWQSVCKVFCDGKLYYVYRRYYLNPHKDMPYTRRDVAIYTDEGIVMDKKEAQKVYAKYKFLCIL